MFSHTNRAGFPKRGSTKLRRLGASPNCVAGDPDLKFDAYRYNMCFTQGGLNYVLEDLDWSRLAGGNVVGVLSFMADREGALYPDAFTVAEDAPDAWTNRLAGLVSINGLGAVVAMRLGLRPRQHDTEGSEAFMEVMVPKASGPYMEGAQRLVRLVHGLEPNRDGTRPVALTVAEHGPQPGEFGKVFVQENLHAYAGRLAAAAAEAAELAAAGQGAAVPAAG